MKLRPALSGLRSLLGGERARHSAEMLELLEPIRFKLDVYDEVAAILASVDRAEFGRVRALYATASPAPGYSKYLEIASYLALQVRYARELGLAPGRRALRVLDVGTGAGYFPLVCKHHGHDAVAIDLDDTPLFNEMTRLLGIERTVWRVEPFVALPAFAARIDYVAAMQIKFASGPRGGRWGAEEWRFFLSDLANSVARPEARVFLGFNADATGVAVPAELARFFRAHGARVDGWKVAFPSLQAFAAGS